MYRVLLYDNPDRSNPKIVHEPYSYGEKIKSSEVYLSINGLGISTFEFTFNINNAYYQKIEPIINFIQIVDVVRNKEIFYGRTAKLTNKMESSGSFSQTILCEDEKAFLYDSVQTYMKPTKMTVEEYLKKIISVHNEQVEPYKKFQVGRVNVADNGDLLRGLGYQSTADTIKEKLLDRLGGTLVLRRVNNVNFLDYLSDYGKDSSTPLQLTKNLKSATRDIDISELYTRIVPVGQDIEDTSETDIEVGTDFSRPKYTIESVNNGKNYLDDPELIKKFGLNVGIVEFSNVTTPSILKTRGEQWLKDQSLMLVTWEVEAIEVGLLDQRYELIQIGNNYKVDNQFIYDVEQLQVVEKKFNILTPQTINLVIGSKKKKLTDYQKELKTINSNLSNIKSGVTAGAQSVVELVNNYKSVSDTVANHTQKISELDEESSGLTAATQNISKDLGDFKATTTNDLQTINQAQQTQQEAIDNHTQSIEDLLERVKKLEEK